MTDRYSILLTRDPRVDVPTVSRPLAKLFRCPLSDITTPLRKSWGILFDHGLNRETAEQVVEILDDSGQPAQIVETRQLMPRQRPRRITWAQPTHNGLLVGAVYEKDRACLPWQTLLCLSVGLIREEAAAIDLTNTNEFQQMVKLEVPEERDLFRQQVARQVLNPVEEDSYVTTASTRASSEEEVAAFQEQLPWVCHLDLVFPDPWTTLRITRTDFCYAAIEGTQHSARHNFEQLLGQLSSAAPDCCPTPITQQFLDGRVREKDLFDDIEQFEDYTRWVCNRLIAAAEQDPPRQSEPVVWSQP